MNNYHRKVTTALVALTTVAAIVRDSIPASATCLAAIALYGFWCKIEPRKIDVTEQTMRELNAKLNAIMIKIGMGKVR